MLLIRFPLCNPRLKAGVCWFGNSGESKPHICIHCLKAAVSTHHELQSLRLRHERVAKDGGYLSEHEREHCTAAKERVTDFAGHCLVALTPIEINSSQDIHRSLSRSTLVEPQTGKIVAHLNESDVITVFDNNVVPDTLYRAWMVITDDDLYIFYEYTEEIEWKGYGDFLTDIDILEERVDNAE